MGVYTRCVCSVPSWRGPTSTMVGTCIFFARAGLYSYCCEGYCSTELSSSQLATTQTYNYHPPLSNVHDPEAPDQSLGDCSICMEGIYVNDSKQLQQVTSGLLHTVGARKNYSLAPCHHLFVSSVHLVMVRWLILLSAYRMPREGTYYELYLVCLLFTSIPSPPVVSG